MSRISNPHDKFFKETFSRLDVVQSFIEEVFPQELREQINFGTLQLTNASFTDSFLAEFMADLVYQTEFAGQETLVTLLFEHKSYTDNFPHWQLLRYMTNIWMEEQKQEKKPSIVIPIIIHHGKTAWKKASLKSYFENPHPELQRFLPEFDYLLFSLNSYSDYQITNFRNIFLSTATMLLKHSRDEKEEFLKLEAFIIEKIRALENAHQEDYIQSVILYLQNTIDLTTNELIIIFTKVSITTTNIAMTVAEQIRLEERIHTTENNIFNHVKGLWENGVSSQIIAVSFGISIQKVEEIIQKIKVSLN